jgi:hypothetical protein
MNFIKNNKGIAIALLIFIVAIGVYKLFSTNVALTESSLVSQSIGADIIELNSRIERVNLDPALFSSAVYKSLVDFSASIPLQPVGRTNPFDLMGR